ncbi:uncharacterized protein LOC128853592 [Cuculus canorus]|uniref:uncharacterized protein LOC128853592 n=1 Tax=Cuculus canorus TaxID=55661 RepID=UPI0023AB3791|nr:uncharacterized protein LOC128853592 [Cuculus canorus]
MDKTSSKPPPEKVNGPRTLPSSGRRDISQLDGVGSPHNVHEAMYNHNISQCQKPPDKASHAGQQARATQPPRGHASESPLVPTSPTSKGHQRETRPSQPQNQLPLSSLCAGLGYPMYCPKSHLMPSRSQQALIRSFSWITHQASVQGSTGTNLCGRNPSVLTSTGTMTQTWGWSKGTGWKVRMVKRWWCPARLLTDHTFSCFQPVSGPWSKPGWDSQRAAGSPLPQRSLQSGIQGRHECSPAMMQRACGTACHPGCIPPKAPDGESAGQSMVDSAVRATYSDTSSQERGTRGKGLLMGLE